MVIFSFYIVGFSKVYLHLQQNLIKHKQYEEINRQRRRRNAVFMG